MCGYLFTHWIGCLDLGYPTHGKKRVVPDVYPGGGGGGVCLLL